MRGRDDGSETRLQRLRVERGNTGEQSDWYQQHKCGLDPLQLEWKSNICQQCCPQRLILFANMRRLATVAQKISKLTLKKRTLTSYPGDNDRKPKDLTPVVAKVSLRFSPASPYVWWRYTIRVHIASWWVSKWGYPTALGCIAWRWLERICYDISVEFFKM